MTPSPLELEILVTRGHVQPILDGRRSEPIRLELDPLRLKTVKVLSAFLSSGSVQRRFETEVLGEHLYELLFSHIPVSVEGALTDARRQNRPLRVVLRFQSDSDRGPWALPNLPWEFLHVPPFKWDEGSPDGFFLAAHAKFILCRRLGARDPSDRFLGETGGRTLRVLLVSTHHPDHPTVEIKPVNDLLKSWTAEEQTVQTEGNIPRPVLPTVHLQPLPNPTKAQLTKEVRSSPGWDVIHYCGHGRFQHHTDADDVSGQVALLAGENPWLSDQTFAETLTSGNSRTKLVVLQACEGGKAGVGEFGGFRGLAPLLVTRGIPAVVALQFATSNTTANAFAVDFYTFLREGRSVEQAVQMARGLLATGPDRENYSTREFGSPVVYVDRSDMALFGPDHEREPRSEGRGKGPTGTPRTLGSARQNERSASNQGVRRKDYCPNSRCGYELTIDTRICDNDQCKTSIIRCPQETCGRLTFAERDRCKYCTFPLPTAIGSGGWALEA